MLTSCLAASSISDRRWNHMYISCSGLILFSVMGKQANDARLAPLDSCEYFLKSDDEEKLGNLDAQCFIELL